MAAAPDQPDHPSEGNDGSHPARCKEEERVLGRGTIARRVDEANLSGPGGVVQNPESPSYTPGGGPDAEIVDRHCLTGARSVGQIPSAADLATRDPDVSDRCGCLGTVRLEPVLNPGAISDRHRMAEQAECTRGGHEHPEATENPPPRLPPCTLDHSASLHDA